MIRGADESREKMVLPRQFALSPTRVCTIGPLHSGSTARNETDTCLALQNILAGCGDASIRASDHHVDARD